jgi:endonuclease/exonuclease/phosphatase family metal-dependent hydrolase
VPHLTVASFNAHAGMDGWGRHYDLVSACDELEADVIVLQESFAPLNGVSQADELAAALSYTAIELPLARAWRRREPISEGRGWAPRSLSRRQKPHLKSLRVGRRVNPHDSALKGYEPGAWGLAVLSRPPVLRSRAIELGRLRRDFTHRGALLVELEVPVLPTGRAGSERFVLVGTHAAHINAGSPIQIRHLYGQLPKGVPAALAGDMNLWGPPLSLLMPGWRRAVKGRTWPAWRPHSQPDHILVNSAVAIEESNVVRTGRSDHWAVRARLSW